jgi:hypothetical protein
MTACGGDAPVTRGLDGLGYDTAALLDSVKGHSGEY